LFYIELKYNAKKLTLDLLNVGYKAGYLFFVAFLKLNMLNII